MTVHIAHSDHRCKIVPMEKDRYNRLPHPSDLSYIERMRLRIKEIRTAKGLTQRDVAESAGVSQSYFTEIESGKKQINARRMESIARALGVAPSDLITDERNSEFQALNDYLLQMSDEQRALVLNMARSLAGSTEHKR